MEMRCAMWVPTHPHSHTRSLAPLRPSLPLLFPLPFSLYIAAAYPQDVRPASLTLKLTDPEIYTRGKKYKNIKKTKQPVSVPACPFLLPVLSWLVFSSPVRSSLSPPRFLMKPKQSSTYTHIYIPPPNHHVPFTKANQPL